MVAALPLPVSRTCSRLSSALVRRCDQTLASIVTCYAFVQLVRGHWRDWKSLGFGSLTEIYGAHDDVAHAMLIQIGLVDFVLPSQPQRPLTLLQLMCSQSLV